jgi:hypothetical protein
MENVSSKGTSSRRTVSSITTPFSSMSAVCPRERSASAPRATITREERVK